MSEENNSFTKEYVQELRSEAANYRTKLRDTEGKVEALQAEFTKMNINTELQKAGITANPEWIKPQEGQTVQEAVAQFKEQYPQLAGTQEAPTAPEEPVSQPEAPQEPIVQAPQVPQVPKPLTPQAPGNTALKTSPLQEIKQDPVARSKVSDLYQSLIAEQFTRK